MRGIWQFSGSSTQNTPYMVFTMWHGRGARYAHMLAKNGVVSRTYARTELEAQVPVQLLQQNLPQMGVKLENPPLLTCNKFIFIFAPAATTMLNKVIVLSTFIFFSTVLRMLFVKSLFICNMLNIELTVKA